MRAFSTAFALILTAGLSAQSEQEPNNTPATANALTLGTPMSGSWCSGDAVDVFSFTTTADGYLQVDFDAVHTDSQINVLLDVRLLDASGTDVDGSSTTSGPNGVVQQNPFILWCVAAGTYYIQVSGFANNECNDYALTAALVQPPFSNDNEPNNTSAQAQVLADNVYTQGHANYSYGGDTTDWFRFDIPGDGRVDLDLDAFNQNAGTFGATMELLDGSLTSVATDNCIVGAIFQSDTAFNPFSHFCLAQGTYYLHVTPFLGCGMSYRIRYHFTPPAFENDTEPNNSNTQALVLTEGTYAEGHLNYTYNGGDNTDWFRFDTPSDGLIVLDLDAFNQNTGTFGITFELLDAAMNNFSTFNGVIVGGILTPDTAFNTFTRFCLKQGTYYLHLHDATGCGMSYRLRWDHTPAPGTDDAEDNDAQANALTLLPNTPSEGHIDFDGFDDNSDWYRFHVYVTAAVTVNVSASHQNGGSYSLPIDLVDPSGTVLSSTGYFLYGGSAPVALDVNLGTLAEGDYYIHLTSPVCGVSYSLSMGGIGTVGIHETSRMEPTLCVDAQVPGMFWLRNMNSTLTSIQVFDRLGKVALNIPARNASGALAVDLTSLATGMYTVSLRNADGSQWSRKAIVAH